MHFNLKLLNNKLVFLSIQRYKSLLYFNVHFHQMGRRILLAIKDCSSWRTLNYKSWLLEKEGIGQRDKTYT